MADEKLKNFIDFIGSTKAKVYYYLFSNIIKCDNLDNDDIIDDSWETMNKQFILHSLYNTFYKKGYLLTWSYQKEIADFIGCSVSTVGKCLKQLEKEKSIGIIKYTIHDEYEGDTHITLYTIGLWRIDEDGEYVEYIGINNKFGKFEEETMLQKSLNSYCDKTIKCPAFFGGVAKVMAL